MGYRNGQFARWGWGAILTFCTLLGIGVWCVPLPHGCGLSESRFHAREETGKRQESANQQSHPSRAPAAIDANDISVPRIAHERQSANPRLSCIRVDSRIGLRDLMELFGSQSRHQRPLYLLHCVSLR